MSVNSKKWLIGLTVVALISISAESVLRLMGWGDPPIAVLDQHIEYYPRPNSSFNRYGNLVDINRYGMRSKDFDADSPAFFHIAVLGDSVVYGNHFLDQSETIAYQLEEKLSKQDGKALVSAMAASSWGPQNIEAFFNKIGPFDGDVAVLVQSAHDVYDVAHRSSFVVPFRTQGSITAIDDFLLRIWEWVRSKWFYPVEAELSPNEARDITEKSLVKLLNQLKEHFPIVLLYYHVTVEDFYSNSEDYFDRYYRSKAQDAGVFYINSKDIYPLPFEVQNFYADDIHLTAEGTAKISGYLYQWLVTHSDMVEAKALGD